jgi:hypothetical protein
VDLVQLPLRRLPIYVRFVDREISSGCPSAAAIKRLQQVRKQLTTDPVPVSTWFMFAATFLFPSRCLCCNVRFHAPTYYCLVQQVRGVISSLFTSTVALGEKTAFLRHAERRVALLPLDKGAHPPPATTFVFENSFLQAERLEGSGVHRPRQAQHGDRRTGGGIGDDDSVVEVFSPVRDVVLMLFRDELLIMSEFSYVVLILHIPLTGCNSGDDC